LNVGSRVLFRRNDDGRITCNNKTKVGSLDSTAVDRIIGNLIALFTVSSVGRKEASRHRIALIGCASVVIEASNLFVIAARGRSTSVSSANVIYTFSNTNVSASSLEHNNRIVLTSYKVGTRVDGASIVIVTRISGVLTSDTCVVTEFESARVKVLTVWAQTSSLAENGNTESSAIRARSSVSI